MLVQNYNMDVLEKLWFNNQKGLRLFEGARSALGHRAVLTEKEIDETETWADLVRAWDKVREAGGRKSAMPELESLEGCVTVNYLTAHVRLRLMNEGFSAVVGNYKRELVLGGVWLKACTGRLQFNKERAGAIVDPDALGPVDPYRREAYKKLLDFLLRVGENLAK